MKERRQLYILSAVFVPLDSTYKRMTRELPLLISLVSIARNRVRQLSLVFRLVLFLPSLTLLSSAFARDFVVINTIPVGKSPGHAVLTPGGRELYVSNQLGGTVTVIDTASSRITATIQLGKSPSVLVASHDGRRVYVLLDDALAIINTARKSEIKYIKGLGRTDDLALTRDDRRLYMTRVYQGVYYLDTTTLDTATEVPELHQATSDLCPIGIAFSKDEQRLFVNYQCTGPGGYIAHDAIGVYELPSHRLIATVRGLANVGGQLALSPDGTELWANGIDACSRPDYDHTACPAVPGRVVNVISTSDLKPLKSYGFSLADDNGTISFSPKGEAFVGGGLSLKEIDTANLDSVHRIPIASTGGIAFQPDGDIAYVTVSDKNLVAVLRAAPKPSEGISRVSSLTLPTVVRTLSTDRYCTAKDASCYRVPPQTVQSALQTRGADFPQRCSQQGISPSEVYRCIGNAVLSSSTPEAIGQALQMHNLEKNEEYLALTLIATQKEFSELSKKSASARTPEENKRWNELYVKLKTAEDAADKVFHDVTGGLVEPSRLQQYLAESAVALYILSYDKSSYTILVTGQGVRRVREDKDVQGKSVSWEMLKPKVDEFLKELKDPCSNPQPLAEELFDILIGDFKEELETARKLAPQQRLTLVWTTEDKLRYIPMAALYDGRNYLAARYSNVLLTTSSAPRTRGQGELVALAAGASQGSEEYKLPPLPGVEAALNNLFYAQGQDKISDKIPALAPILLNPNFTRDSLSVGLHNLQERKSDYRIVHIASHFVLSDAATSFLLLGSGSLNLSELGDRLKYPFDVDLLTLSACNTAAKIPLSGTTSLRDSNGSEVEGLGYFMGENSGAHSVLASLWEVSDDSTSKLMQNFYMGLRQGMSKAEALQRAELELRAIAPQLAPAGKPRGCGTDWPSSYQHPYFWAPFILIGDWH